MFFNWIFVKCDYLDLNNDRTSIVLFMGPQRKSKIEEFMFIKSTGGDINTYRTSCTGPHELNFGIVRLPRGSNQSFENQTYLLAELNKSKWKDRIIMKSCILSTKIYCRSFTMKSTGLNFGIVRLQGAISRLKTNRTLRPN